MDHEAYDEYRLQLLSDARGVEHYVVKQLAWLRRLPINEMIWNEIRDLMSLQKSIQLGGPEVWKRAINYLLGRRRYQFWERMGRLDPNEVQEESMLPDERAAVRYGWGHSTADEQPRDPGAEGDSWSDTDRSGAEKEEIREPSPPPVVTEETGASSSAPAAAEPTTTGTSAGGKGKHGGTPFHGDEAELHFSMIGTDAKNGSPLVWTHLAVLQALSWHGDHPLRTLAVS